MAASHPPGAAQTLLAPAAVRAPAPAAFGDITTLRVGGPIGQLVDARSEEEFAEAVRGADAAGRPIVVLGGGSNVLAPDAGAPLVVRPVYSGVRAARAPGADQVVIEADAGTSWDALTALASAEAWSGFEALAGIPGSVGAAPVQNIGAYGHEVSELVTAVRVWDRDAGAARRVPAGELAFGYRTSALKAGRAPGGAAGPRAVVLAVEFAAPRRVDSSPVAYGELAATLGLETGARAPAALVRDAVLALRGSKGMVLDPADPDTRSAGSFFTNPVIPAALAARLPADAPRFPAGTDAAGGPLVKTSAAWLMTRAGIDRGWGLNPRARTSSKHVWALTNAGGATARDVAELADALRRRVAEVFGIALTPEPVCL
ncbi:MAG: UDP-N-acetylmuramate dehydrogenase [Bifidobacteriaceae bacterium]|jgi:UDP-N-acetylmuramate dehydrogenase|nr:UDP-N-acetylmuramate dehydrogenase [Bifidobacteriaceae bacterium]